MKRLLRKASDTMTVIYAQEEMPKSYSKSIFLAGPSPRDNNTPSWRPEAIEILEQLGYDGIIFNPETRDKNFDNYDNQIKWEQQAMQQADCIVFWIPRDLETLPGFTTNIEWGMWAKSGKVVIGFPDEAPKTRYLDTMMEDLVLTRHNTLSDTLQDALTFVGDGSLRNDGETLIPLYIWNTDAFQNWYVSQVAVGNEIRFARYEYVYKPMPKKDFVFLWVLYVQVYIKDEDRIKDNELVISRTDLCGAVLYNRGNTIDDTKIVLVKEFRSSVSNAECFVYEIPSGSSKKKMDNIDIIAHELEEETGVAIPKERIKYYFSRQMMATLVASKYHLYSVELSDEEIIEFENNKDVHGVIEDSERTYVVVKTVKEILQDNLLDWTNIGMIFNILHNAFGGEQ